jgi:di/tricarboxylate transporter
VFSFPLSQSFLLIIITYLFSQGIANSGLVDILLEPILVKYANTPIKVMLFNIIMFIVTIFIIPQPLARLILVAMLFKSFISKTNAMEETKNVLMFSCFLIYTIVNMSIKRADIILNTASVGFAELNMSEVAWFQYMSVPVALFSVLVFALFIFLFKKDLLGVHLDIIDDDFTESDLIKNRNDKALNLSIQQKYTLSIVVITLISWMTESMHGLNSTLVTLLSTIMFFLTKTLDKKDFKAIDITTLVFLTAAFSIGGVLKFSGVAGIVFSKVDIIFPKEYSILYVVMIISSSMLLHMILGSNTTTLSVVIPGLIVLCKDVLPIEITMFMAYLSIASHSILPFHSIPMMIGASNGYFPSKYVTKMGIPVTILIYISILFIFIPWWKFMGLM